MSAVESIQARELWRFNDLKFLGIVADRATLRRWIRTLEFPPPMIMSANSVAWPAAEVRAWLAGRPRGLAPQPGPARARQARAEAEKVSA